ncbi:trehalose 6-phosphate phosphorylase [Thermoplasmatales archaeon SW_10_69_26]|nr:MAG: trehalose 6-phosphate phosphorylase [Thermoplasmatales archaeon SW_10_69_26]
MNGWTFGYRGFSPDEQPLREALTTLGNGYVCTRGAEPEASADDVHYPGTYLAGGYDRQTSVKLDQEIQNEDLVNMPNWLPITFRAAGGPWFRLEEVDVLDYEKVLDLETAMLTRRVRFRDDQDRTTKLVNRRIVSMANPHRAAQQMVVEPLDWSGQIQVETAIDGTVENANVERYQDLESQHLDPIGTDMADAETMRLLTHTDRSRVRVAQAARTKAYRDGSPIQPARQTDTEEDRVRQRFPVHVGEGRPVRVEKICSMYTGRDPATSEPGYEVERELARAPRFLDLYTRHTTHWRHLWGRFGLQVGVSGSVEQARVARTLRLHILHLLQTASFHTTDFDVGVPARGWHGEAYRGHIFWDEMFVFPTLNFHVPQIARSLLRYRFRRLDEARRRARRQGYEGAMFPWQSGSNGEEESQQLHLNPRSGRWIPDETHLQRHINASIAYSVWHHYHVTGDMEFLALYGAEMLLSIARFWASFAGYDHERGAYEITGVVGPDEYHTRYPWRDEPGLDNNAYTNVMAAWCLERGLDVLDILPKDRSAELVEKLRLTHDELDRWDEVSRNLFVPIADDGLVSQFEGYHRLEEFDWEGYEERYDDIQRLDRILEAEDDDANRYKASKQPDVVMLFYLFSPDRLAGIFDRLGYSFDPEAHIPRNVEYYIDRTSHGSTLSYFLHAWALAELDPDRSWQLFQRALDADVEDIQGGTTHEGIHLGSMTGAIDLVQRGYTGLSVAEDVLAFDPAFPDPLESVSVELRYRGHLLEARVREDEVAVTSHAAGRDPVEIGLEQDVRRIGEGDSVRLAR